MSKCATSVAAQSGPLLDTARALAHLDVYASLAEVASRRDYVRPEIVEDDTLDIRSGRHPVVEAAISDPFVPNDNVMDSRGAAGADYHRPERQRKIYLFAASRADCFDGANRQFRPGAQRENRP